MQVGMMTKGDACARLDEDKRLHFLMPASPLLPQATPPQSLVLLSSIEDDGLGEELQVIWELEPGTQVYEWVDLPQPTGFDDLARLDAFLDAVRSGLGPLRTFVHCKRPSVVALILRITSLTQ